MTTKEAIWRIEEHMTVHRLNEPRALLITEALEIAIKSLEKEVPKKPKHITKKDGILTTNYECPICGSRRLGHGFDLDKCYCPECGQKLDWSD